MSYCVQCGKMVPDGTTLCQDCQAKSAPVQPVAVAVKQKPKVKKIWIGLGIAAVVVVAVVLVLVALFRPRDLRMEDFQKVNGFTAYFHYGVPVETRVSDSGETLLDYEDNIKFYGITPDKCVVFPETNHVTFFFTEETGYNIFDTINHYCDLEGTGTFYEYSYGDLEITVAPNGWYVNIDIC